MSILWIAFRIEWKYFSLKERNSGQFTVYQLGEEVFISKRSRNISRPVEEAKNLKRNISTCVMQSEKDSVSVWKTAFATSHAICHMPYAIRWTHRTIVGLQCPSLLKQTGQALPLNLRGWWAQDITRELVWKQRSFRPIEGLFAWHIACQSQGLAWASTFASCASHDWRQLKHTSCSATEEQIKNEHLQNGRWRWKLKYTEGDLPVAISHMISAQLYMSAFSV